MRILIRPAVLICFCFYLTKRLCFIVALYQFTSGYLMTLTLVFFYFWSFSLSPVTERQH